MAKRFAIKIAIFVAKLLGKFWRELPMEDLNNTSCWDTHGGNAHLPYS
jgi:hypothetical protein